MVSDHYVYIRNEQFEFVFVSFFFQIGEFLYNFLKTSIYLLTHFIFRNVCVISHKIMIAAFVQIGYKNVLLAKFSYKISFFFRFDNSVNKDISYIYRTLHPIGNINNINDSIEVVTTF